MSQVALKKVGPRSAVNDFNSGSPLGRVLHRTARRDIQDQCGVLWSFAARNLRKDLRNFLVLHGEREIQECTAIAHARSVFENDSAPISNLSRIALKKLFAGNA